MKPLHFHSLQILCAVSVGFGLSLPFVAVGGTTRSAYGLVRTAHNLDLVNGIAKQLIAVTVICVPMMVGGLLLGVGLGYRRIISVLSFSVGALGLTTGIASLLVSSRRQVGSMVTVSSGIATMLITTIAIVQHRRAKAHSPQRMDSGHGSHPEHRTPEPGLAVGSSTEQ